VSWYLKVLNQYVDFRGRARRREFWMFWLVTVIVVAVLGVIDSLLHTDNAMGAQHRNGIFDGIFLFPSSVGLISGIYVLLTFLPTLAVMVRRLHDRDHTGWWVLILLIPIIGFLVMLVFTLSEGTRGPNRHGADPKAAVAR
jgi:uncharacterized membrane protein YhaH (DUF805 family)